MSSAAPAGSQGVSLRWQERLRDYCRSQKWQVPEWHIVSDKRGGRTAWSSNVDVGGRNFPARYWYDGPNVNNAKEDAAENALLQLGVVTNASKTDYKGQCQKF